MDSGTNSWLGIGAQVGTWASASVARTKFVPILTATGGLTKEVKSRDDLTSVASERGFWNAGKKAKFASSHRMDYEGYEMFLKRLFGAGTPAQQGGTSAYKTPFTLANTKILCTVERCMDNKSLVWPANKIIGGEFSGDLFDPVTLTMDYLGRDEDALAAPTGGVTFSDDNLILPTVSASTLIKLGGVTFPCQSWKVRLDDPLREDGFYIGNAQTIADPGRQEKRTVTGEVTMEMDGSDATKVALYAAYQGGTESSFQAIYVGAQIGATGFYYTFDLNCARIVLTGTPPDVSGPGIIELTLPFKAYANASGTPDAITLDLTNEITAIT